MAEYIANFELNRNTLEFVGELSQNQLHADLIVDYRPSKTSQLINDSGYITIADVPTKLSELVNDTGFITASALIPLENDIIEIESDILDLQNSKVDKVTGKGLSTNDFTNADKTKLDGIEVGAEVNTVNSVNGQVGDVTINIPTKTSDLTNNSGFITNTVNNLTNYYLTSETYTKQEVNQLIADIPKFKVQIVQALPQTGEAMVLYLVPKVSTAPDVYDEYIWIETSESFELIGTTAVDLTGYATEQWVLDKGYITGIDGSDVTNALGYTPYNSLNPSNYTSVYESTVSGWGFTKNTGTVTSVNNIQPVNGNVTLPSSEYTAGMGLGLLENEFKVIQNDTVVKNFASIGNGSLDGNYNYTGASKSYLLLPNVIQLNTANSWEFQTTYKYNGGGSRPTIIGYYNNLDCKTPAIFYDGNAGIRLLVSTNGSSWNILTNGFTPVTNTTYNIKAGFTGSEYYLEYKTENETSWTRLSVQNSTKCYCNEKFILMNLGWNYSNYYSAGTMDLKATKIIVNNSIEWEAVTTTSSSGFVAKATNLLYGLVKPDNSSITVNDGIISSHITSSDVTTALGYTPYNSTNPNGYVTEQYVDDIVGDIETILASI